MVQTRVHTELDGPDIQERKQHKRQIIRKDGDGASKKKSQRQWVCDEHFALGAFSAPLKKTLKKPQGETFVTLLLSLILLVPIESYQINHGSSRKSSLREDETFPIFFTLLNQQQQ